MKLPTLSSAILQTVKYSAKFEYPLLVEELLERLVKNSSGAKISATILKKELKALKEVELADGFLIWKKHREWIGLRKQREHWSKEKWLEVEQVKTVLQKIPWIEEVYVTGSLAVNNVSKPNDDIDLCVVTQPNRLWLVRLWVIAVTSLRGKYRLHDTTGENSWCFNLWLTKSSLTLEKNQRSLYTAYEIIQAKQILGKGNGLVESNQWIGEFLQHPPTRKNGEKEKRKTGNVVQFSNFPIFQFGFFFSLLNQIAYKLQFVYMKPHLTIERVGREHAFFHPRRMV